MLRLLAVYALRLCAADTGPPLGARLRRGLGAVSDTQGRALVDRISRLGRAQNITPMLATQVLGDAAELEGLVGALFAFGVETEAEARGRSRCCVSTPTTRRLRQRLIGFRAGRCYLRDYDGRVAPIQIDPPARLLGALDTTPRRAAARRRCRRP